MNDKALKATLAVHEVLSDWAENTYIKRDPLGSMAMSRFKKYRDEVRKDIQTDPELQRKLEGKLAGIV